MKKRWKAALFALIALCILLAIFSAFLGWLPERYVYGFLGLALLVSTVYQFGTYRETRKKFDLVYALMLLALSLTDFFLFLRDIGLLA